MAGSEVEVLGAGTKFEAELDPQGAAGTFTTIETVLGFGEIGQDGELVQTTPICETSHTYIAGMQDGKELAIVMNDKPGNATHESFVTKGQNKETIKIQVVYPNGRTAKFAMVMTGFSIQEAQLNEQVKCGLKGKISGDIAWSVA